MQINLEAVDNCVQDFVHVINLLRRLRIFAVADSNCVRDYIFCDIHIILRQ